MYTLYTNYYIIYYALNTMHFLLTFNVRYEKIGIGRQH
jgi:hypothetical protein